MKCLLSPDVIERVRSYIDSHEDEIIADLKHLVSVPSIRSEGQPGMPFGPHCAHAVELAADLFERSGYPTDRRGSRGYAVARAGTGSKTLGVFCHCDVVRTDTGVWEQIAAPFCPEYRDGYLIGRGVRDNKGGVVAVLHAMNALRHAGISIQNRIQVFLGGNEEMGMQDIINFKEDYPMPDLSLVPDSRMPLCIGESSDTAFLLRCDRPFERIIDFFGGTSAGVCGEATVVLPNDALLRDELTRALEGCDRASLSEDGAGQLLLKTVGATAHPASPFRSINAGGIAAGLLLCCPSLGAHDLAILKQVHGMLTEVTGTYFGIANYDAMFKDLTLVFFQLFTRDGHLSMTGMTNFSPAYPVELLRARIQNRCIQTGWSITFRTYNPGFLISSDHPAVSLATEVHRTLCQLSGISAPDDVFVLKAATYARHLTNAFGTGFEVPPTVAPPSFSSGHGHGHQPDECLCIPNYKEGIVHLAFLLACMDRQLDQLTSTETNQN